MKELNGGNNNEFFSFTLMFLLKKRRENFSYMAEYVVFT